MLKIHKWRIKPFRFFESYKEKYQYLDQCYFNKHKKKAYSFE